MKKTFNINIGNSIIHIEEDAYEILTVYLNEVKYHFSKNADDFEIVTDIENRIAEMFGEILSSQQKQVINIEDVKSVTAQMGSVKDFENSENEEEATAEQSGHFGAYQAAEGIKKLYRDPDQAMVGGVCAGLGHYLDIEARWIRLAAFFSVFLGGSGVVAYLIMWIVIPVAQSKSEKMAMRGEEPNLRGFANSHLNPLIAQSRGFLAEFFEFLGNFIQGAGRTFFKVIATGIVIFGSIMLLMLMGMMACLFGVWDSDVYNYFPLSIVNESYTSLLIIAAFVVFAVPLLALVLFSVRVAFNRRPINKVFSFGLLIVWLAGIVLSVFYITKITMEFKEEAEFAQVSVLTSRQTLFLNVDKSRFFTKEDSLNYQIDPDRYRGRRILNGRHNPFDAPRNLRLRIEKSDNGKTVLLQNYSARGKTFDVALKNAQNIHYSFLQQDSVLNFSPNLQLTKKANWRDQKVDLLLKVPVGTVLKISRDMEWILNGHYYWDCREESNAVITEWIMTDEGLKCLYERKDTDSDE